MKNTAVLVVDLLKDFTQPTGNIYYETTGEMMPRVIDFIQQMRKRGAMIVYIQQIVSKEDAAKVPQDLKFRMCCVEGSGGEEFDPRLPIEKDDIIVQKRKASGFFRTNLEDILREHHIENVVVIGTKTNCCVRATATDSAMRDFRTFIISDCVSTNTAELNRFHCEDINKYTAKAMTAASFIRCVDLNQI